MQNRKIAFRAWVGKMEYNVGVSPAGAFYFAGIDPKDSACFFNTLYSEQCPIMQFTGLLDKNGKEIYEGDIVHITPTLGRRAGNWQQWSTNESKPIVFHGGAFRFDGMNFAEMLGSGGYPSHIGAEIIGNIYENPKLLA